MSVRVREREREKEKERAGISPGEVLGLFPVGLLHIPQLSLLFDDPIAVSLSLSVGLSLSLSCFVRGYLDLAGHTRKRREKERNNDRNFS